MSPRIAIGVLILSMASMLTGTSFAKSLFSQATPVTIAAFRLLIAALLLNLWYRPWQVAIPRSIRMSLLIYGLSLAGMNCLIYLALSRIPIGIAVALEFTGPLLLACATSRRRTDFLWIGLAFFGVLSLTRIDSPRPLDALGVIATFLSAACWALYILMGRRVSMVLDAGTATAAGMAIGSTIAFPIALLSNGGVLPGPALFSAILVVAIFSSMVPYMVEMVVMKYLPISTFGVLMSLQPALGALSAWAILQEKQSLLDWVGIGAIMMASAGVSAQAGSAKQDRPPPDDSPAVELSAGPVVAGCSEGGD
jgi:inner membrane transporter RhtA